MDSENQNWILVTIFGGILMIIGATTGNLILYFLSSDLATGIVENEAIGGLLFGIIVIFGFIAESGGISVILGALLIMGNHYKIGKLITNIATGFGLIGFIILVIIEIVTGTIAGAFYSSVIGMSSISEFFGVLGLILTIFARREIKKPRELTKFSLKDYVHKRNISVIITLSFATFYFVFFEILLISVFTRFLFLDFSVLFCWQILAISIYFLTIILTVYSRRWRILSTGFISVFSVIILIFIWPLQSMLLFKIITIVFFTVALIGSFYSVKFVRKYPIDVKKKNILYFALIFTGIAAANITFLTIPEKSVIISPKTNPELIFWVDPYYLPDDNDTLNLCRDNNIGFMVAIAPATWNVTSLMTKYKTAINHSVNLHFSLLTPPDPFASFDTIDQYVSLYQDYRDWFTTEGIMNSTYIKSFNIDAEPPKRYIDSVGDYDLMGMINYLIENFPTKEEQAAATEELNNLNKLIRSDGKEAGIIRITTYMDELDGDGDIELLLRNLYSLDVFYDYSISMVYRTEIIPPETEGSAEAFAAGLFQNVFGSLYTEDYTLSAYNFYYRVGIEQTKGEINATNQYIFIGNLDPRFNGSEYMLNKEYLDDLDICRHYNEEKVFFFNYMNFIDNYGVGELDRLVIHNQEKLSWELKYTSIATAISIVIYLVFTFLDRLLIGVR